MAKVTDTRRGIATKEGLETIAQRFVRFRKEAGLSQAQMAEKLGISQPVVSDYERGASARETDFESGGDSRRVGGRDSRQRDEQAEDGERRAKFNNYLKEFPACAD